MKILFALFVAFACAQSRCSSGGRTWNPTCGTYNNNPLCEKTYTWVVDPNTANYIGQPMQCTKNPYTGVCYADTTKVCYPDCVLNPQSPISPSHKVGGSDGQVCSSFTTQANCAKTYVDDYGDRWCFWKNGFCNTGTLCYT